MDRFYRYDGPTGREVARLRTVGLGASDVRAEWCFYVEAGRLGGDERMRLQDLFGTPHVGSSLDDEGVLEIGPRLSFESPVSSTLRSVCHRIGVRGVARIERFRRFQFVVPLEPGQWGAAMAALHDPMLQAIYNRPLTSLFTAHAPEVVRVIPVLRDGPSALERANKELIGGLGMTDTTMRWMYELFAQVLRRDPTDVEVVTLAQANSEHCRHQTMRGELVIDGRPFGMNLFDLFTLGYKTNPNNSVIAFHDDASAIRGGPVQVVVADPVSGDYVLTDLVLHATNTAETHNGPTEIGAYPGAATGPGGEIRDGMSVGRGGIVLAGGVGICVANLLIPGYELPWETSGSLPRPGLPGSLTVLTDGSDGASDYANCFGRPVITGHAASFDLLLPDGSRHAWRKPALYAQGVGVIRDEHLVKTPPQAGMLVVQIGGPAYPIGIGGGSFSSKTPDSRVSAGDLNAIQRPDPAVERGLYDVIRKCIELGPKNPIESAHDLGAGGDANALPEIVGEAGGRFDVRLLPAGDAGMSVLQIFVCEAQERCVVLVRPENWPLLQQIARRESAQAVVVGYVTGDGVVTLEDTAAADGALTECVPVDLPASAFDGSGVIEPVKLESVERLLSPLGLPDGLAVRQALERVFRLMTVGSKHFLTDKADRSVGGLVAQQQGVGPFHTPLCGYGLTAVSTQGNTGIAYAHGERHRFGFISPAAQARMSVVEALQKFMGVAISDLPDIRFSGNWLWPPLRTDGSGARMFQAAKALAEMCVALGIAEDGGKDSIFMQSFDHKGRLVVSPAQLVLAPYVTVPDVRKRVTPEVKEEGNALLLIDLSAGHARLGGSALAQVYGQVGDDCPDLTDIDLLKRTFTALQVMVRRGEIVALHGRSDGGLVTTLAEMAIAGGFGLDADLESDHDALAAMFSEEAGVVVECANRQLALLTLKRYGVPAQYLGRVTGWGERVRISHNGELVVDEHLHTLRALWSETSSQIDATQSSPESVLAERKLMARPLPRPKWRLTYGPQPTFGLRRKPRAAVLRGPANNGQYEMAAAALAAGFTVADVNVEDLINGRESLDDFQGVFLPGGFSYGDIPDAGAALAAVIKYNDRVAEQVAAFRARSDTFGFGACNGAQLMLRLGWAPFPELPTAQRPRFIRNRVERHKSSFVTVEILNSTSVMFTGMAGSRMGVWVSHGEGRLHAPDKALLAQLQIRQLVPMRYVSPDGEPLEVDDYPYNPSGTPFGWPAVCSVDGRFTAVMPHPERMANQLWQWPWLPQEWRELSESPWLQVFQNARDWCLDQH